MNSLKNFFINFIFPIFLGCLIAFLLNRFVFSFYTIRGESMMPTFQDNDYIVTQKITGTFSDYKAGDIVIVTLTDEQSHEYENQHIIKRVVATEGDTVEIIPESTEQESGKKLGTIQVNGKVIEEDYIYEKVLYVDEYQSFVLEKDEYFVLGDNRNNSADSRVFGVFHKDDIDAKVLFEFFDNIRFY